MESEIGFAILPAVLSEDEVNGLLRAIKRSGISTGARQGGIRNLLSCVPEVSALAAPMAIHRLVKPVLGEAAFAARAILFDKTPDANWNVPWHQDLTIAVESKLETAGYGPWTMKNGVIHVQPPTGILERMLAVRIHLDECTEDNGALRVIPGSHRLGRLSVEEIHALAANQAGAVCPVQRGGAILMRPLLLHASSKARVPAHRRVIHIEFAAEPLPGGLQWAAA